MEKNLYAVRLHQANRMVRFWRKILRIDPLWQVSIGAWVNCDADTLAQITTTKYWRADIMLSPQLLGGTQKKWDQDAESTIIHELIHLLMVDYDSLVETACGEDWNDEVDRRCEMLVSKLELSFMHLGGMIRKLCKQK